MLTAPLRSFPVFDSHIFDDVIEGLGTYFHDVDASTQNRAGFRAKYNCLDLGRVSLHGAAMSTGYRVASEAVADNVVIPILLDGEMHVRSGRKKMVALPGKLVPIVDFHEDTTINPTGRHNNICLRYTQLGLIEALSTLTGCPPVESIRFPLHIDLSRSGPQRFAAIVKHVVGLFESVPSMADAPLLVTRYEELLLTALLTCVEHSHSHLFSKEVKSAMPRLVRLAEAYIEANLDKPLRLSDVVAASGAGGRSIQLAFQKYRGYTLSSFMRERRLLKARAMLQQAQPNATVLAISQTCGFASPSYFSRLYRERFGEKPSQTIPSH